MASNGLEGRTGVSHISNRSIHQISSSEAFSWPCQDPLQWKSTQPWFSHILSNQLNNMILWVTGRHYGSLSPHIMNPLCDRLDSGPWGVGRYRVEQIPLCTVHGAIVTRWEGDIFMFYQQRGLLCLMLLSGSWNWFIWQSYFLFTWRCWAKSGTDYENGKI